MVALKGTGRGGPWVLAPALEAMWREANALAPNRRRTSDGSIGDEKHAQRQSLHNPDEEGALDFVDALDITHDPANGMDIHARIRAAVARLDRRIEEAISNRQIWTWARRSEGWRPYTGSNPHVGHGHIGVRDEFRHDTSPWFAGSLPFPTPGAPPYFPPNPTGADAMTPEQRAEVVGRLDRALGLLESMHPAVAQLQTVVADPTSGLRQLVINLGHQVAQQKPGTIDTAATAKAIVAALPADLAAQVATELGRRLVRP